MSLAEHYHARELETQARILTFDIETQRAIVSVFSPFTKYIPHQRVLVESRILCFAARWHGEDRTIFRAAWKEDAKYRVDPDAYEKMLLKMWELLNEAQIVLTWNGDRFDVQWVHAEMTRLGLPRPASYKSVDLIKVAKKHFNQGLMYRKLDWSARMWLGDQKIDHNGRDLWDDIRFGTRAEKLSAQKLMREYCEHDTALTERIGFEYYLPYLPVNMALYRKDQDSELLYCTKCGATGHLKRENYYYTGAFGYQQYRCEKCGGLSRGKRNKITTELRAVP
jgi:DNA polymerase elongation subunit (family B)